MKNKNLKKFILFTGIFVATIIIFMMFLDKPVFSAFRTFGGEWTGVMSNISSFKFWVLASAIAFGTTAFLRIVGGFKKIKNKTIKQINITSLYVLSSVILAGAVGGVLKTIVGRMRPIMWEAFGKTGFYPLSTEWVFNSFPSGHTLATFAALVSVGFLFPKYRFYLWVFAAVAGFARIAGGAHWPSDVIAGAAIGITVAGVVNYLFAQVKGKR
ncbi:MAG: phosphatase PAP2 family protein [Alphaproteobacteria bacterium]|nr:phosphatase PAP2 family protein [Alphaproteobacteria bacterium]